MDVYTPRVPFFLSRAMHWLRGRRCELRLENPLGDYDRSEFCSVQRVGIEAGLGDWRYLEITLQPEDRSSAPMVLRIGFADSEF